MCPEVATTCVNDTREDMLMSHQFCTRVYDAMQRYTIVLYSTTSVNNTPTWQKTIWQITVNNCHLFLVINTSVASVANCINAANMVNVDTENEIEYLDFSNNGAAICAAI